MSGTTDRDVCLRARDLVCGYPGGFTVGTLDLDVFSGQVVCLIGPNGAGKSTILSTLAGELPARSGTVTLCGHDLAHLGALDRARLRATLLTERRRQDLLTCRDIVELGRYPHTGALGILRKADHEAVERALRMTGTAGYADLAFARLSDGQRQRIMLARAIAQEPRVLMLDEPCSFLDIAHRIGLVRTLRHCAETLGVAIVATMHELPLVSRVADWVVGVSHGTVCRQGTTAEMLRPHVTDALFDLEPGTFDPRTGAYTFGFEEPMPREGGPCTG